MMSNALQRRSSARAARASWRPAMAAAALLVVGDPAAARPRSLSLRRTSRTAEPLAPAQQDQLLSVAARRRLSLAQATSMAQSAFQGRVVRARDRADGRSHRPRDSHPRRGRPHRAHLAHRRPDRRISLGTPRHAAAARRRRPQPEPFARSAARAGRLLRREVDRRPRGPLLRARIPRRSRDRRSRLAEHVGRRAHQAAARRRQGVPDPRADGARPLAGQGRGR